jgi:hypothetical protein
LTTDGCWSKPLLVLAEFRVDRDVHFAILVSLHGIDDEWTGLFFESVSRMTMPTTGASAYDNAPSSLSSFVMRVHLLKNDMHMRSGRILDEAFKTC